MKSTTLAVFLMTTVLLTPSISIADSALEPLFKTSQRYSDVLIKRVISSDTVELDTGERIKLIGIRSPEIPRRFKREDIQKNEYGIIIEKKINPITPIEKQAYDFTQKLLEGKRVRCELDKKKTDANHATLVYIFLPNKVMANTEILRNGFAHLKIRPPNLKYAERLREAYREARREKRGLQSN